MFLYSVKTQQMSLIITDLKLELAILYKWITFPCEQTCIAMPHVVSERYI